MPRQRPESKHARRPTSKRSKSQAPAPVSAKSRAPQKWGHESEGLGSYIVESIIESVVTTVAHRVGEAITDAIMGPRVVKYKPVASNIPSSDLCVKKTVVSTTPISDPCVEKSKAFEDCIGANGSDAGECEFYMNMLTECRKAAASSNLASESKQNF